MVEFYVRHYLNLVAERINDSLQLNINNFVNIDDLVSTINCSQGLSSIYKQDIYFEEKFGIIKPLRIQLGSQFGNYGPQTTDGSQTIKTKKNEMIFIPITTVLGKWFENGQFGNMINIPRRQVDGVFSSYVDGSHFQNHSFRLSNPDCTLIRLYYDEAEMCDAVGSKAGLKNKLGFFYWMLEDLSLTVRSQVKFINLTGIVPYPYVKKYGMKEILKPFVQDFKKLEDGVRLTNGQILRRTCSVLSGDNLAAHQICGFRESFSATHPCRYCMASAEEIKTMTKEDITILRNPDEHDRQVDEVENANNEREKENLKTLYGINRGCPLTEIEGFHPMKSALPDIVHDDLLGYCVTTTRRFLKKVCIDSPIISLEEVNERKDCFDY